MIKTIFRQIKVWGLFYSVILWYCLIIFQDFFLAREQFRTDKPVYGTIYAAACSIFIATLFFAIKNKKKGFIPDCYWTLYSEKNPELELRQFYDEGYIDALQQAYAIDKMCSDRGIMAKAILKERRLFRRRKSPLIRVGFVSEEDLVMAKMLYKPVVQAR